MTSFDRSPESRACVYDAGVETLQLLQGLRSEHRALHRRSMDSAGDYTR